MTASTYCEKMIHDVVNVIEEIGFGCAPDVARKINVTRPTASKYLKKAEERGLIVEAYRRRDMILYSLKSMEIKKRTKTPLEINEEAEKAFEKYQVID